MAQEARPRWKWKRFGEGADLYLRGRWLGDIGPLIQGECRYTVREGDPGVVASQEEAKRRVEEAAAVTSQSS